MEERVIKHEAGCKVLARFGSNPFNAPVYRLVRADSRRQWSVGEFRPKYPKFGTCYVIEKWCPASQYGTQESWEEAKDENGVSMLGPYPAKGDYEFVLPLWDENDQPILEPGDHHLQAIAWMVETSAGLTRSTRWAMIQQAEEKAKEIRMKKLQDMIADAAPLRGGDVERKYAEDLEEASKMAAIQSTGASLSTGA